MKSLLKTVLVAAFGATALAASAGEISGTKIDANQAENLTNSDGAFARQEIGATYANGRLLNSEVWARGARNHAASRNGRAQQLIGLADGGTMDQVTVRADRAFNQSTAAGATANQIIGAAANGTMVKTTVDANDAQNKALDNRAVANQWIGMVTNGTMKNSTVNATGARNLALKADSSANQQIGVVN